MKSHFKMKRKFSIFLLCVLSMMMVMLVLGSFAQTTTPNAIETIANSVDATGWILIFTGWLMYWMKKMDEKRMEQKRNRISETKFWVSSFIQDNLFEVPTSLIACFVLVIFAPSIPPDLIDLNGRISNFLIGFAGSSILNGLITKSKTKT